MIQSRLRWIGARAGTLAALVPIMILSGCAAVTSANGRDDDSFLMNFFTSLGLFRDDTELVRDLDPNVTPQMAQDYLGQYQLDARHKVFAISPSGAFGVAEGFSSVDDAKIKAVAECEKDLQPGDLGCVVYDVDGVVVFRPPQRVTIIQAD